MTLWGLRYEQSAMQRFELSPSSLLFEELCVWAHRGRLLGPCITFQICESSAASPKGLVRICRLAIYLALCWAFTRFYPTTFGSYYKRLLSMCFISICASRSLSISEAESPS